MLSALTIYKVEGIDGFSLPVSDHDLSSPYVVRDITGLEPVKANFTTSTYPYLDGGTIANARVDLRQINIEVEIQPHWYADATAQNLRQRLYSEFPIKSLLKVRFWNDEMDTVEIDGVVESVISSIFSEELYVTITLLCPQPYFETLTPIRLMGVSNTPLLTGYYGNADSGFSCEVKLEKATDEVALRITGQPDLIMKHDFKRGDILKISTVVGRKFIKLVSYGTETSILSALDEGSLSMSLSSKSEEFRLLINGDDQTRYTIEFYPRYSGL